ncbi:MAG: hypothetical protein IJY04_03045, partial [Clostridia bacterium]|nr:hypothetical protein [Clostridia bacterium]
MEEIKVDGYKKYKGAVGKAHKKSRFKRMGLSSAIVMEEGIAISSSYTSMARNGMKVPNIEIMTSEDGESVYKTNLIALRDFEVDAEKVRLCGEDEEIEIDNPSRLRHDDYSGIRQALEKKYFGAEFPGD